MYLWKPVATDGAGINIVLAANEEAKKKSNGYGWLQRHHEPNYIETVKKIQDGAIGEQLCPLFRNSEGVWSKKEHRVKMSWNTN